MTTQTMFAVVDRAAMENVVGWPLIPAAQARIVKSVTNTDYGAFQYVKSIINVKSVPRGSVWIDVQLSINIVLVPILV